MATSRGGFAAVPLSGTGEVSEAGARGPVADAYASLRRALGVPFVPTLYRMLARHERLFVAAVASLEPLLAGDSTRRYSQAARARGALAASRLPGASLDAAGKRPTVLELLQRYNRANPLNLLFVLALRPGAVEWTPPVMGPAPPRQGELLSDVCACHGGFTVPGVWRELAEWPELASRAWELVRPLAGSAELRTARDDVIALAQAELAGVSIPSAAELGYGPVDVAAVRETLAWFPHGIATMVIEIEFLRHRLEADPEPNRSAA